jgi:hypothetical protein
LTGTPQSTTTPISPEPAAVGRQPWFWATIILGGVLGVAIVATLGWILFQRRLTDQPESSSTA